MKTNSFLKYFLSSFLTVCLGEIFPFELKSCKLVEYIDSLYEYIDLCVVIYYEDEAAYNCPLAMNTTRSIHVSRELVMGWTAFNFQHRFECKQYLIGTSNPNTLDDFFTKESTYPRFVPYTNIILFNSSSGKDIELTPSQIRYSYSSGLFMLSASLGQDDRLILKNLLTNETFQGLKPSFNKLNFLKHPFLAGGLYPREITISLFHCPPFVIATHNNATNQTTYDGVEYKLIVTITKEWNRQIIETEFDNPEINPYMKTEQDVITGVANVSTGAPWLVMLHYRQVDLSHPYDTQCLTFLVPRPRIITAASYIYLPFNGNVWIVYISCLVGTSVILHYFVKWVFIKTKELSSLEVVFLEVVNIATSHGATRFPNQVPIKILITSWLAISLLLSTAYCTGYTSLLTTPKLTKPVDTIADFLEQGLTWSNKRKDHRLYGIFKDSESETIRKIAERYDFNKNDPDQLEKIASGKYAKHVLILGNNYVTETECYGSHAHYLRRMKECFYKYYSVLLLRKGSPYTAYFDHQIYKLYETGIIAHWFTEMNIKYGKRYILSFFEENLQRFGEARSLELENVVGAFYLLAIGLGMAVLVFIGEIYASFRSVSRV